MKRIICNIVIILMLAMLMCACDKGNSTDILEGSWVSYGVIEDDTDEVVTYEHIGLENPNNEIIFKKDGTVEYVGSSNSAEGIFEGNANDGYSMTLNYTSGDSETLQLKVLDKYLVIEDDGAGMNDMVFTKE